MSVRNMLGTITTGIAGSVTKTFEVIDTNLDSVLKLSRAGNHMAGEIEDDARFDADKAQHRLNAQRKEWEAELKALTVQAE